MGFLLLIFSKMIVFIVRPLAVPVSSSNATLSPSNEKEQPALPTVRKQVWLHLT